MDSSELIELFYNRTYEKFVNKQILDDKNYVVPRQQLINYVNELVNLPFTEFINYIKRNNKKRIIDAADITQFSSFSACEIEICDALIWANNPGCQFVDIGRLFPKYVNSRNDVAYKKYGENHVKTATQLGLTFEYYNYWYLSCIGYIYPDLEVNVRKHLLARTLTRNVLYQQMLLDILKQDIDPVSYMSTLSEKTILRRQRNVCLLFKICLEECEKQGIKTHDLIINKGQKKNRFLYLDKYSLSILSPQEISSIEECSEDSSLSETDILNLIDRYKNGDQNACNLLVKCNLNIISKIADLYKNKHAEFDDLTQEGVLGLIFAIQNYKYYGDNLFTDFAKFCINRFLFSFLCKQQQLIKIPPRHVYYHSLIRKFSEKYYQQNGFDPSIDDIVLDDQNAPSFLNDIYNLPCDLSEIIVHSDCFESLTDDTQMTDTSLIKDSNRFDVLRLVCSLSEREKDILVEFYGLNGKEEKTLEEIGSLFSLTRERVRQIKEKSIRKLRVFLKAVKDKDIEELSSLKVMERRWKGMQGNQFYTLDSSKLYTEGKEKLIKVSRNTKEKSKNHFKEYINGITSQLEINRVNNIPDLKRYILQVFKQTPRSLTSYEVYLKIARLLPNETIRKESVEYLLREMPEVDCTRPGWYQIKRDSSTGTMVSNKSHPNYKKEVSRDYEVFSLSTPLNELVKFKILTRKDCKFCRRKGLFTISDVKKKIQEHNLTPDSTRFTQYTIKMWFKIVGLLESNTSQKDIKEKKDITLNNHPEKLEEIYKKYTHKILIIRQAKIKGKVIIAKPALLLAVLNGIDDGVFSNNRILLNDWLVNRYNKLMGTYNNNTSFTEIGMPFWYMQSDGFWHLKFAGILKEKVYTPSRKWLNNNVEYAYFDDSLWLLLQDKEWRMKLRNFILDHKLSIIMSEHTQEKAKKTVQEKARFEDSVNSFDDLEIEYVKVNSHGKVISTSSSADEKIHQMGDRSSNKRRKPWTENEEKTLTYFFKQGRDVATLAKLLRRTEVAIKSRLGKLGLIEYTYGQDEENDTE